MMPSAPIHRRPANDNASMKENLTDMLAELAARRLEASSADVRAAVLRQLEMQMGEAV
ncbi:hypothetical protein MesoLjLc_51140 [Mesorhizobium sp. L-8-10]|uniref:hypothetical protein n=1 Tax=Mesorhizobium sp. L-8-10 TaxID=2744523 RepID=UPI001928D2F5|nr:hypothetical protein [Mesorhizobium sp. L-8-10]BCH33184.1 hypothetical protein MesoLjLc_51140 [Mesorhizobium sp. L-8-10]